MCRHTRRNGHTTSFLDMGFPVSPITPTPGRPDFEGGPRFLADSRFADTARPMWFTCACQYEEPDLSPHLLPWNSGDLNLEVSRRDQTSPRAMGRLSRSLGTTPYAQVLEFSEPRPCSVPRVRLEWVFAPAKAGTGTKVQS